jgi:hypothetical protein
MKRKAAKRKTAKERPGLTAKPLRPPYTISPTGINLVLDSAKGGFRRAVPGDFAGIRNFPNLPPHAMQVFERTAKGEIRPAKRFAPTTAVHEIPLPPDFEEAVAHYAADVFRGVYGDIVWEFDGKQKLEAIHQRLAALIRGGLEAAFRDGFYLALLHHADDLKTTVEAAPLIESLREAARKGGAARRAKAEPTHKAIRKRFRELRKTTPKKTVRYLRVAEEFDISERHVARIVDGID